MKFREGLNTGILCRWWHIIFEFEVWEWCKDIWYSNVRAKFRTRYPFENDVKIYGIQTKYSAIEPGFAFENDVKIYGIQTEYIELTVYAAFENDVKIYGIQTIPNKIFVGQWFENDVKIYGIQTI